MTRKWSREESQDAALEIGRRLRAVRTARKWSATRVEREFGVSARVLLAYELGKRRVDAADLAMLAELYGVPAGSLMPGDPSQADLLVALDQVREIVATHRQGATGE